MYVCVLEGERERAEDISVDVKFLAMIAISVFFFSFEMSRVTFISLFLFIRRCCVVIPFYFKAAMELYMYISDRRFAYTKN